MMKVLWHASAFIITMTSSKLGHCLVSMCLGLFQNCGDREGINIRRGATKA